jgi:cytochrome c oxidase subunit 4
VDANSKPTHSDSGPNAEEGLGHVVDLRVLGAVFAALMVLTAITVAVSYFDFGVLNLLVAMGVATVKAALVALYFMHLRYDSPFNAFIFVVGVAFLALFLVITMLDTIEYYPYVEQWQESKP